MKPSKKTVRKILLAGWTKVAALIGNFVNEFSDCSSITGKTIISYNIRLMASQRHVWRPVKLTSLRKPDEVDSSFAKLKTYLLSDFDSLAGLS